jgi:ribonuclease H / adenosylcobalamin/alpha-ribazole phosphatase
MISDQKQNLRFFLVRHGETAENVQMRYLGTADEPLNETGQKQAKQAAEALSQLPIQRVIASPMRRAADTARQIQQACNVELQLDARLAEGSFGRWEGLSHDDVLRLGSPDTEILARWESDPFCAPPGGEAIIDIQKRVVDLLEELKSQYSDASIVLVSHVGPIKALIAAALDIPLQSSRRFFLDPGSISVVEWSPHRFLRLFNSHAHLGWSAARWMGRL